MARKSGAAAGAAARRARRVVREDSEPKPERVRVAVDPLARYKPIRKMADSSEGEERYFCDGCMHGFAHVGLSAPTVCGHCGAAAADMLAALKQSEGA